MHNGDFICESCGNRMRIIFLKGIASVIGGVTLLIAVVILVVPIGTPEWIVYSLLAIPAITVYFTLRVRC